MSLTAEQRRALAMLAGGRQNGATQSLLSAHGLNTAMIRRLVDHELAITTRENVRVGAEIGKVWITDAGRSALAAEG